jgi:hypothetical protein
MVTSWLQCPTHMATGTVAGQGLMGAGQKRFDVATVGHLKNVAGGQEH